MTKVDKDLLDTLLQAMLDGGFSRLTFSKGKTSVTLTLAETARQRSMGPEYVIKSPGMGVFATQHPMAAGPLAPVDAEIKAGDIVALLAVGLLFLPVEAPVSGRIRQIIAADGDVVGFDDPLFKIEERVKS